MNIAAKRNRARTEEPTIIEARMKNPFFHKSGQHIASRLCLRNVIRWYGYVKVDDTVERSFTKCSTLSTHFGGVLIIGKEKEHNGSLIKKYNRTYYFHCSNRRQKRNIFPALRFGTLPCDVLAQCHQEPKTMMINGLILP